jgi:hypothetical protein
MAKLEFNEREGVEAREKKALRLAGSAAGIE